MMLVERPSTGELVIGAAMGSEPRQRPPGNGASVQASGKLAT
jgi:hypothetical protein